MKILILIPARGGSKGIKNKNLVRIGKKKLIDYTLDLCNQFNRNFFTFISTDSKVISNHCKKNGFKNNYIRPAYLSKDKSTIIDTVFHALNWLKKNMNYTPEAVLLLQPTSPIRDKNQINKAIKQFIKKKQKSLVGVVKMKEHPRECINFAHKKWNYLIKPNKKLYRRQEYEDNYYFIDGSFYLAKTSFLKKYNSFIVENNSSMYRFDQKYILDIDDMSDLKIARSLLTK